MATARGPAGGVPARFRGAKGAAYRGLLAGSVVVLAYLVVVTGYLVTTSTEVIDPSRAAYPLVWFSLSAAALAAAFGPDGESGVRRGVNRWPAVVAAGYVLLLAGVSGQLSIGSTGVGLSISGGLPGWAPVVVADLAVVGVVAVPFQSIGYVVLGALLARALSATTRSALAGVLGLFTCAGCVLPIVAAVASIGSVPLLANGLTYDVSTAAFALTATLLAGVVVRERAGSDRCER
ncbi:DUF7546 family protein [Halorubrum sp. DTA98]|uniref:DUF7546 family protein n=1 Tax=Halorubrum sp. DTA98 TaxID=3402163 RepID=UPI003AAAB62F